MTVEAVTTPDLSPREERKPAQLSGWMERPGSDKAFDFTVLNLSYGGCRLETDAPLARGEKVVLHVHRRGSIPAVVRWRNGHGIGLSFTPTEEAKPAKPRKVERLPLNAEIIVRRAGRRAQSLEISDLSRFGCCLQFVEPPRAEDWIWVALPSLAPVEARVRWVENHRAGVEFVRPIHESVFELLLVRWGLGAA